MSTLETLRAKRDQILELASHHGVRAIRIFGSVAREEDTSDSDLDLLVTVGPETSSWFPAGLILDLEPLLGRRVEVITEKGLNPHLRDHVLAEAVAL